MKSMLIRITVALFVIYVSMGCGGGGGGGGIVNNTSPITPTYDATGTWSITETTTYDNLDAGYLGQVTHDTYAITQTDTTFLMDTTNNGSEDDGTVSGSDYTYSMSYHDSEFDCNVTIDGVFALTSETTLEGDYTLEADAGKYVHILGRSIVGTKN